MRSLLYLLLTTVMLYVMTVYTSCSKPPSREYRDQEEGGIDIPIKFDWEPPWKEKEADKSSAPEERGPPPEGTTEFPRPPEEQTPSDSPFPLPEESAEKESPPVEVDPVVIPIYVATGRDPSIAVGKDGAAHITYTDRQNKTWYCKMTSKTSGCVVKKKVNDGFHARIVVDSMDRVHICSNYPGSANSTRLFYSVLLNQQVTTKEAEGSWSVKCRLAVDAQDRVFLYYQHASGNFSGMRLRLITLHNNTVQIGASVTVGLADPDKDARPGNIAIDQEGNAHFLYRRHPGVDRSRRGLYYRKYLTKQGRFSSKERKISEAASDFSDITINRQNRPHALGLVAGSHGLLYLPGKMNPLQGTMQRLFAKNPKITQISDGDHLNVQLVFDVLNRPFAVFCGAGVMNPQKRVAYFIQALAGQDFTDQTKIERLTPNKAESNQGKKYENPHLAPAKTKGVLVVWGEEDGKVYLRGLGGGGFY